MTHSVHPTKDLQFVVDSMAGGLLPDPDLTVDKWADKYQIIPRSTGANEYGPYRTERTPHAREIMKALSNNHPCKKVVCRVASQMFKTQIAINWFGAIVHQSPANMLWLMPTGNLQKRIAARLDKTIAAVPVLKNRVVPPQSKYAQNNQNVKEFVGGAVFIATAGSAANLSEVPARYLSIDEVDRCVGNVDGEGDPVKLGENRQTTYEHNRKSYYYSSPTIEGLSRIDELFDEGTQRHPLAECVHCGHLQQLHFKNLVKRDDGEVCYPCGECGAMHTEIDKTRMFRKGAWTEAANPNTDVESFAASAMFLPFGRFTWGGMFREHEEAKKAYEEGDETKLIVFYNTRLALSWSPKSGVTEPDVLQKRAEDYPLGVLPQETLVLTAGVDNQIDRFEVKFVAWGRKRECWIVDYRVVNGDPSDDSTKKELIELLRSEYVREDGVVFTSACTMLDTGGAYTQDMYDFCRTYRRDKVHGMKGGGRYDAPILPRKPTPVDIQLEGSLSKKAVAIWVIGVDAAKDYLHARWSRESGPGAVHFSHELEESYYRGLTSEHRERYFSGGRPRIKWAKDPKIANEPLDLMVMNLAAAYKLGLHRYTDAQYSQLEARLKHKAEQVRREKEAESQGRITQKPAKATRKRQTGGLSGLMPL